jgi:hypothetical protein
MDFRITLGMVFVIILLTGAGCVLLAVSGISGQSIQSAQDVMAHAFTAAVGALIGLIGGRSAS